MAEQQKNTLQRLSEALAEYDKQVAALRVAQRVFQAASVVHHPEAFMACLSSRTLTENAALEVTAAARAVFRFIDSAESCDAALDEYEALNCPCCGGSGHVEDINPGYDVRDMISEIHADTAFMRAELEVQLDCAEQCVQRLKDALTPSAETKAEYIGEFTFTIDDHDEDGQECARKVTVPWCTTKEIMAAIRKRAGLPK